MPKPQPPLPTPRKPRDLTKVREVARTFEHSDASALDHPNGQAAEGSSGQAVERPTTQPVGGSSGRAPRRKIIQRGGYQTKSGKKTGGRGTVRKLHIELPLALGNKLEAEKHRRWQEGLTLGDIIVEMMRATGRAPELPKPPEGEGA